MVGGKTVDNVEVLPQSVLIFLSDERRTHFHTTGTDARDVILCQEQVMRSDFTRHRKSARFRRFDNHNLEKQGDVL